MRGLCPWRSTLGLRTQGINPTRERGDAAGRSPRRRVGAIRPLWDQPMQPLIERAAEHRLQLRAEFPRVGGGQVVVE
jgi:hypothetical protein